MKNSKKTESPAIESKPTKYGVSFEEIKVVATETGFSEQTREIAIGVLIERKKQNYYANKFGISNAAVHDALKRFVKAVDARRERALKKKGFVRVDIYLPEYEAFRVQQIARKYAEEINGSDG